MLVHLLSMLLQKAGIVLLAEPVSVQAGKPVDVARLTLPRGYLGRRCNDAPNPC